MARNSKGLSFAKNSKGSITLLLVFLPLALALGALAAALALTLSHVSETKHLCRSGLLSAQKERADALKKLMAFNPRAETLRLKYDLALRSFQMAPTPHFKAIAAARLARVVAQQKAFAVIQKGILFSNDASVLAMLNQAHQKMKVKTSRSLQKFKTQLQVDALPKASLSPSYFPKKNFSKLQEVDWEWDLDIPILLANPIFEKLSIPKKMTFACLSTLTKENNEWVEVLSPDKF